MSTICGLFRPDGALVTRDDIGVMLQSLDHWGADANAAWLSSPNVGFGCLLLQTTPHSTIEQLPINGDIRLDNRAELITDLGAAPDCSDARVVWQAYERWGIDCVSRLRGDFAFALWDERNQRLLCARDHFGVKPFYYYTGSSGDFAFASEVKGLLALNFVDRALNEHWIGDFLQCFTLDGTATLYARIRKLEPAHMMVIDAAGVRSSRYWTLNADEIRFARADDYVEVFREKLVNAIRRRVATDFEIGAELSGGLDSCAIAVLAARLLREQGRELHTFSQVRPEGVTEPLPEDGRATIEMLQQNGSITRTCFLTGQEHRLMDTLAWAHRYYDEPPNLVASLYNQELYDAANASGVRVLLSGFGGNQGVTAIGAGIRAELLWSLQWRALWRELTPTNGSLGALRSMLALIGRELRPFPEQNAFWRKYPYRALRDDVARRLGMRDRAEAFVRLYSKQKTLRGEMQQRLYTPNVALRLEYGHLSATTRRIEYRYPLLDTELIGFYYAVPWHLKHHRGVGRYLFRRSMEDTLPDEIRWASGVRASANPGIVMQKRRERAALLERIHALPHNHPVFDYVDLDKLLARPALKGAKSNRWERDTELMDVIMLADRLAG